MATKAANGTKNVVVLANKTFEADALMAALQSRDLRPTTLPKPMPPSADSGAGLRAYFAAPGVRVEIWCLEDELPPTLNSRQKSRSFYKVQTIPRIIPRDCSCVIAFGTAATPWETTYNGSVVVGSATLNHSPTFVAVDDAAFQKKLRLDSILASTPAQRFFANVSRKTAIDIGRAQSQFLASQQKFDELIKQLKDAWRNDQPKPDTPEWKSSNLLSDIRQNAEIESKFIRSPRNAAVAPCLFWAANWLAVSSVNVPSYDDFNRADEETVVTARKVADAISIPDPGDGPSAPASYNIGSIETTHGLIRLSTPDNAAFAFVSGITDRLGHFSMEVTPQKEAQNFAAALNAGVVVGYMLERILANPRDCLR